MPGIEYTRADAASLVHGDEAVHRRAAADEQPARLQRVAVVGVADHLGEGAVGESEHRAEG